MKVDLVHETGDELIVTAARASFNRRASEYTYKQNDSLTAFLVDSTPPHWAPLAHVRITLTLPFWGIIYKKLTHLDKAGMKELRVDLNMIVLSHSLWGWHNLLKGRKVHFSLVESVIKHLKDTAPVTCEILNIDQYRSSEKHENGDLPVELAPYYYATDFVTLRVELPIAMARQFMKHLVGYVYSEASGRYITYSKIYTPTLHGIPKSKKQGSGDPVGFLRKMLALSLIKTSYFISKLTYNTLHRIVRISAEEARCVMPMYTGTVFVVTASREDWDRFLTHRLADDAQTDIRALAKLVDKKLKEKK